MTETKTEIKELSISSELLYCTAEAYRIYHMITDHGVDDRQYELAKRLERLLKQVTETKDN